jgi:hypothetical protein
MTSGRLSRNLTLAGTVAVGAWLSMRWARRLADGRTEHPQNRAVAEPVRELVEEVLVEHRTEDTPMVHAFEAALDPDEGGKSG